jgi:hypothetical protein
MVLTYNAYTETLEDQKEKEDELQTIKEQFNNMQSQLQTLITALGSIRDQTQINQTAQILYKSNIEFVLTNNYRNKFMNILFCLETFQLLP